MPLQTASAAYDLLFLFEFLLIILIHDYLIIFLIYLLVFINLLIFFINLSIICYFEVSAHQLTLIFLQVKHQTNPIVVGLP